MSDTSYPAYQHYGTNAQRLAFTPSPPASGKPIYIWYETDTGSTYLYDTSWHALSTGSAGTVTNTGTLTSGTLLKGNGGVDITSITTGTGIITALGVNTGSAGAPVLFNGAGGTPTSITLTNGAGLPAATGLSGVVPGTQGGGLVLLEQHAASNSASLNFTTAISATYDDYVIDLVGVVPATTNTDLYLLMSTNGGVSYDTGSNYQWVISYVSAGFTTPTPGGTGGNGSTTQIKLAVSADNTSTAGICGRLQLMNPGSTSLHKNTFGTATVLNNGDAKRYLYTNAGWYLSTSAVNAFQFLMSSGNIASGTIRVYGLAK